MNRQVERKNNKERPRPVNNARQTKFDPRYKQKLKRGNNADNQLQSGNNR